MCPNTYRQESLPVSTSKSDQKARQEKQLLFVHTTRIQGTSQLSPSLKSPPGWSPFPKGLELLPSGTIRIGIDYRSERDQNDTSRNRDLRRWKAKTSVNSMHKCFETRENSQPQEYPRWHKTIPIRTRLRGWGILEVCGSRQRRLS